MDSSTLTAFITYAAIMALTPGPNNILALSCAGQYGLRASSPLLMGMCGGFAAVMLLCGLCALTLSRALPHVLPWLTYAGAGYIAWLAWRIASASSATGERQAQPPRFMTGFLLQFVNVKVVLTGLTGLTAFVLPRTSEVWEIVGYSLILATIGASSNWIWGMAGDRLRSAFQRWGRGINITLGLSLLYCVAHMLME